MKTKLVVSLIFFTVIVVTACKDKKPAPTEKETEKHDTTAVNDEMEVADTAGFKINRFQGFPPGIDGCTCYFAKDSLDFKKGIFVFINSFASIGIFSANGELERLRLVSTTTKENVFRQQDYTETYNNRNYIVKINVLYIQRNGDETWLFEGKMEVTDKKGITREQTLYGECGC